MAEITELQATVRDSAGKVAAQRIRRTGGVPCIIYGGGSAPEMITLNYKEVWKHVQTGSFLSTVCMLDIDGKKTRVIPRDIQFDPVRDFVEHIDFLRISKTSQVEVEVPVVILNEALSPGLKRGGMLNLVRHEIELSCPADAIPEHIEVDVTGMEIGDVLHISGVSLPAGVTPVITDRDFTVLTIVGGSTADDDGADGEGDSTE